MKTSKIICIIILAITLIMVCTTSFAAKTIDPTKYDPGKSFEAQDYDDAIAKVSQIYSVIYSVAIIASVIMTMVLGIKYMTGSVEQKAEYKKTVIPVIIGLLLIFTITTIVQIILSVMQGLNT